AGIRQPHIAGGSHIQPVGIVPVRAVAPDSPTVVIDAVRYQHTIITGIQQVDFAVFADGNVARHENAATVHGDPGAGETGVVTIAVGAAVITKKLHLTGQRIHDQYIAVGVYRHTLW